MPPAVHTSSPCEVSNPPQVLVTAVLLQSVDNNMESDTEDNSNSESEVNNLLEEDKCKETSEECNEDLADDISNEETGDPEVNILSREDKFKALNVKCERVITYLTTGKHVNGLTKNQKRLVRAQAKAHIWDKSRKKLYYIGTKDSRKVLVIRDENEVDVIVQEAHVRSDGGHHGINNTATNVASKYFWNSIRQDVVDFVSKCYRCQLKNRGPSKKVKDGDPIELVEVDYDEDVEFTHEATKALIEAVRKRHEQLSDRHSRPIVYKEVQEELSQLGFCFNKERVRRKWNTLVAMHRRMKREIYQKNPPWEYYQMIDTFHGGEDFGLTDNSEGPMSASTSQGDTTYTISENNTSDKQGSVSCPNVNMPPPNHQGNVYPTQQHNNVYSIPPGNTYPTLQGNNFPVNHGNSYPAYGGHSYTTSTTHQTGTYDIPQVSNFPVSHGNASYTASQRESYSVPQVQTYTPQPKEISTVSKANTVTQGSVKTDPPNMVNKTVPAMFLKIVPDLSGIYSKNTQVQPIAVVGTLPGQKTEIKQVSSPQIIVNKPLPKQNLQVQNTQDEFLRKHEKLKLKTLMRIEKELKNISRIQYNILNKQEEILSAVKTKDTHDEKQNHIEGEQESSEQLRKKMKM